MEGKRCHDSSPLYVFSIGSLSTDVLSVCWKIDDANCSWVVRLLSRGPRNSRWNMKWSQRNFSPLFKLVSVLLSWNWKKLFLTLNSCCFYIQGPFYLTFLRTSAYVSGQTFYIWLDDTAYYSKSTLGFKCHWQTQVLMLASQHQRPRTPSLPLTPFQALLLSQCLLWNKVFVLWQPKNWIPARKIGSRAAPTLCSPRTKGLGAGISWPRNN